MRLAAVAAVLLATVAASAEPSTPVADAEAWVKLVDTGRYADSWSAAGTVFRERVTEKAWTKDVEAARKPLGAVVSRETLSETQAKTLPGAPDGSYAIIQFSTAFTNKKSAIETVVLAREPAGWRVDGYFVK